MTILAHISDLHFGREDTQLVDGVMAILDSIQPELVIISGDITQRARKAEFLAAHAFLDSLPWPDLVIAGNHDIPAYNIVERFFFPWRKWHRYLGQSLEPRVQTKDYIAMGLNTARRSGALADWSRGRINDEQIHDIEGKMRRLVPASCGRTRSKKAVYAVQKENQPCTK